MSIRNDPDAASIRLQEPVSAVLARSSRLVEVFVRRGMACPGCAMAPFMTLAEAAASYGIDPQRLLGELQAAVQETQGVIGRTTLRQINVSQNGT